MYVKTFEDFRAEVQPLSHSDRKKYFKDKYPKSEGEGTARIVYDMGDGTVIKVAKNPKGIQQNLTESNPKMLSKYGNILAKVIEYHPKGKWIIQEKVDDITEDEFEQLTGYQFNGLRYWILWHSDKWFNNKKFPNLLDSFIKDYDLEKYDLMDIKSWGKNSSGKVVLKDYGLDMRTARKLYKVAY